MKVLRGMLVLAFTAGVTYAGIGQAKHPSCATIHVNEKTIAMRGGPPVIWNHDGTMANQAAIERHYALGILGNPALTRDEKRKLLKPETFASLEEPMYLEGGDPHPPGSTTYKKGGGGEEESPCTACPQYGCPCACWGTLLVNTCEDAAIDCRQVSPDCPL